MGRSSQTRHRIIANARTMPISASSSKQVEKDYAQLLTWADVYGHSSLPEKKMIVANLIRKVTIGRDYQIEIEFNFIYDELQKFTLPANSEPSEIGL